MNRRMHVNNYLKNLEKIEFVVTYACTGSCKHCSEGEHNACGEHIAPSVAADAVKKIASAYKIKTVMAFGGEPLLYPDAVYAIMSAARDAKVEKRQVITNGYFSKDEKCIKEVAKRLFECGVNDLLLSADAFHQESIPLETVKRFAAAAKDAGVPVRVQPAWLVSRDDDNPYNLKTKEIIGEIGIDENEGNIIFPEGNAVKYLSEYFTGETVQNPYVEDAYDVKCVSFDPNGDVLCGNVYQKDVLKILDEYEPK